jgi:hypothetical protein
MKTTLFEHKTFLSPELISVTMISDICTSSKTALVFWRGTGRCFRTSSWTVRSGKLLVFKHNYLLDQVDMKIIFYELIRMLSEYGKNEASEVYDDTKTIPKIEGYQELTNRLLRRLCKVVS